MTNTPTQALLLLRIEKASQCWSLGTGCDVRHEKYCVLSRMAPVEAACSCQSLKLQVALATFNMLAGLWRISFQRS